MVIPLASLRGTKQPHEMNEEMMAAIKYKSATQRMQKNELMATK
jgi:hypothetical protein